jgi:hypothetical protein
MRPQVSLTPTRVAVTAAEGEPALDSCPQVSHGVPAPDTCRTLSARSDGSRIRTVPNWGSHKCTATPGLSVRRSSSCLPPAL